MNQNTTHVNILGVKVNCYNKETILGKVKKWAKEDHSRTITYVNAHCINLSHQNSKYREAINQADIVYSDGISIVWASRLLGGCPLEKITGREWIFDFCDLAITHNFGLYFLGAAPGIASEASKRLKARYPKLNIVGSTDGYFNQMNNDQILERINISKPHVLLVGMGIPRQDLWIYNNRKVIDVPICWSVGALFDYLAGVEPSVPEWMDSLALEWLWRLFLDPKGKWKRYIIGNPLFAVRIIHQKLSDN